MKADFAKQAKDQSNKLDDLQVRIEAQQDIVKELFALVETLGVQEIATPTESPKKDWAQMSALEKRRASKD